MALLALAAGLGGCDKLVPGRTASFKAVDVTGAEYGRALALTDAEGQARTLADFKGKVSVVFFGYTHCPDVCPATIGELMQVLQARPDVRVVFVTVDPERDTPEFLAEWTKYLPEGMVGVTGSPLAIRHAADQYGVRYARVDTDSRSGYAMSHTAFQYLIDPEGNLVLTYPFGTPAAAILGDLDAMGLGA